MFNYLVCYAYLLPFLRYVTVFETQISLYSICILAPIHTLSEFRKTGILELPGSEKILTNISTHFHSLVQI